MADFDFPEDLLELQRALRNVAAELNDLLMRLPHRAMPMPERYADFRGVEHEASPGWTEEQQAQVDALRLRRSELAGAVLGHEFWTTLSGPDVLKARMQLKHVDEE
ncbi:hypothetical protein NGB36_08550 [Streptomyces sp. RB6PN25]|uniref:Uncharacterized protein n=1 Tax=Streptomyces humicola TaxID=2953240 RepID=A0ABT1PU38_9ACTN|nr:hypothetical protein [Streptomyces humicola]MCQ4080648.1 hypothetical protein [Streptomyces humicola]